jgi:transcription elongation factor Elf1
MSIASKARQKRRKKPKFKKGFEISFRSQQCPVCGKIQSLNVTPGDRFWINTYISCGHVAMVM